MAGKLQDNKDFHAPSNCIFSFVITYFYINNKFEKMNEKEQKWNFQKSDNEDAFTVFELIFSKQVQFNVYMYRVVENSKGYPNI